MHDAQVVSARQRRAHLFQDVDTPVERHRSVRQLVRERRADQVLHHQVQLAIVGFADVVDVDDVSVVDAVGRASLAQHPRAQVRFAAEVRADQLHRDHAIDQHVAGAVHDAHATFADARFEAVSPSDYLAESGVVGFLRTRCRHGGLLRSRLCHVCRLIPLGWTAEISRNLRD